MTPRLRALFQWFFPGPGLGLLVFIFMAGISWQRWADPIIDFGRQLYVPWALSQGQMLYQDIDYFFGPLSSYLHALIFYLFGPGLLHLALFNLVLIGLFTVLIQKILKEFVPASAAALGGLVFLGAFAFACHRGFSSLNYVTPYTYDLTHGIFLSFWALYVFIQYTKTPGIGKLMGIGFLWGLVYLTKVEVFLSLSVALGLGFPVYAYLKGDTSGKILKDLGVAVTAGLAPVAVFLVYFSTQMSFADAAAALTSPWTRALNPDVWKINMYRDILGASSIFNSMTQMAAHAAILTLVAYLLYRLNAVLARAGKSDWRYQTATVLGLTALLTVFRESVPWLEITKSFPLFILLFGGMLIRDILRDADPTSRAREHLPLMAFILFSFVMTFKVFFNLRMYHIGFALALPATLVMVVFVFGRILPQLEKTTESVAILKSASYTVFIFSIAMFAGFSTTQYQHKTFPIGRGADLLYDFSPQGQDHLGRPITRGLVLQFALDWLENEIGPKDTVLTLPDSQMINYQLKRRFPTAHANFDPLSLILRGEKEMLKRLQAIPPDYVVYVHMNHSHFGFPFFGKNFGIAIHGWVLEHYEMIQQVGPPPFAGNQFGIQIFKRVENPSPFSCNFAFFTDPAAVC